MPEGAQKSAFWLEGDWDQDKERCYITDNAYRLY